MINKNELDWLRECLDTLAAGYSDLPDIVPGLDQPSARKVLLEAAERMQDNYPYHHPLYAGQMLKPPHPVARIAYALSLWVNPNNHALDGGRASSAMEKECVVEIGEMFGWQNPLGHLTGGGTMANLEALWVAKRLHAGKRILASQQAHYTHGRISEVLGITFTAVAVDDSGRLDLGALEAELQSGDVGTVVATIGNTGLGAVDPLPELLSLQEKYDFRIHADAAYGGYFSLASQTNETVRCTFDRLKDVDSIVIDPHKHGLQPYGCGCVLFKDPSVGRFYKHGSPYTYFSSAELHLGEISLECSRPGASAVALWATQRLLPLVSGGDFAADLDRCLMAARAFHTRLEESQYFVPLLQPELDIVVYACQAATSGASNEKARAVFEAAAENHLHLALIEVPVALATKCVAGMKTDTESITCLRSTLMKPEHEDWVDRIVDLLEKSAASL